MSLKSTIKSMISALPGGLGVATWDVIWTIKSPMFREQRRTQQAMFKRLGCPERLLAGPFAGMRYIRRATGSAYLPKLVGTYEYEIRSAIENVLRSPPDLVLDIGSAEGYYAVGLALQWPTARIITYDIYKPARYLLRTLAELNDVERRIDVRRACSPSLIESDLASALNPLIICDCEGFEDDLLRPGPDSLLSRARLIVEVHEYFRPGVGARLKHRFGPTHDIREFHTVDRDPSMLPIDLGLTRAEMDEVMNERRTGAMQWLYMLPRTQALGGDFTTQ